MIYIITYVYEYVLHVKNVQLHVFPIKPDGYV